MSDSDELDLTFSDEEADQQQQDTSAADYQLKLELDHRAQYAKQQDDIKREREEMKNQEVSGYQTSLDQSTERLLRLQRLDECGLLSLQLLHKKWNLKASEISTMAGSFDLGLSARGLVSSIDLEKAVAIAPSASYSRSKRSPCLDIKLQNPQITAQVTTKGKVLLFGAKTTADLYLASRRLTYLMRKSTIVPSATLNNFRVTNIVLSADAGRPFPLDLLIRAFSERAPICKARWQAGGFPCLIAQGTDPEQNSVKIFGNGSILVMGLTSIAACTLALDFWLELIGLLQQNSVLAESQVFGEFKSREVIISNDVPKKAEKPKKARGRPKNTTSKTSDTTKRVRRQDEYDSDELGDTSEYSSDDDDDSDGDYYSGSDSD